MSMVVSTSLGVRVDGDGAGPEFLCSYSREVYGCCSGHACLSSAGIFFITITSIIRDAFLGRGLDMEGRKDEHGMGMSEGYRR